MTLGRIETTEFGDGGADLITSGLGGDIVLGGADADRIDLGGGHNVAPGRQHAIDYVVADADPGDIDRIESLAVGVGGSDTITSRGGDDIIIGGAAGGRDRRRRRHNVVLGDNGVILSATAVNGTPDLAQPLDHFNITLGQIGTISPLVGGDDVISTGVGRDIILGGFGERPDHRQRR